MKGIESSAEPRVLVGSIQKFSTEDGPGIRTTIFLKGCPLRCRWCHNPELIDPQQQLIQSPASCIGCGSCIPACPAGAIALAPAGAGDGDGEPGALCGIVIRRSACDVCLKCTEVCYAQALRPVAREMTAGEILEEARQDKGFYDNTGGGITLSGGEVLMHADFARRIIRAAAGEGIGICLDTCGFGDPDVLLELAGMENVTDILYDMKSIDDEVHRAYTGVSNKRILENLRRLAADGRTRGKLTLRMPLVAGVNDGEEIIRRTRRLRDALGIPRVTLHPYHDLGRSKMRNLGGSQEVFSPPSEERLAEIAEIMGCDGSPRP